MDELLSLQSVAGSVDSASPESLQSASALLTVDRPVVRYPSLSAST